MSLSERVAQAVVDMAHIDEFKVVWSYFREQDDLMVQEILSSGTDPVTREILVRLRELFKREVVDLPERSVKLMDKPKPAG